jgi:hypothetical protein
MKRQHLAIGIGLGVGAAILLSGCAAPPQVLDTHTGEWETPPADETPRKTPEPTGWQCDGQPCTPEQLQQLVDLLEQAE